MRLTLSWPWPEIFDKHPIPWRMSNKIATAEHVSKNSLLMVGGMVRSVLDANGDTIFESDQGVTRQTRLYDLYVYVTRDMNLISFDRWIPPVLIRYPTPWTIGLAPPHHLYDRSGVCMQSHTSMPPPYHVAAAYVELSQLAAERMRLQESTVGFPTHVANVIANQRARGYRPHIY